MRLKVLAFKALYIISINVLSFIPKFRSIVVVCCTFIIWWLNFVNIPFYTGGFGRWHDINGHVAAPDVHL